MITGLISVAAGQLTSTGAGASAVVNTVFSLFGAVVLLIAHRRTTDLHPT